jgi:ureidoglycolate lyase
VQLTVEPLEAGAFAPFGDVLEPDACRDRRSINAGYTTRFHDLCRLVLDAEGGQPCLSIFRTRPLPTPLRLTTLERHPLSSQAFYPLSGRGWLVVVAPAGDLRREAIRAFRARSDQGVNFHPGTWHHFSLALEAESDFLVVDRSGGAPDCDEVELAEPIEIAP